MNEFVSKVRKSLTRHNLLHPQQPVIVALSGGADSVALLAALTQLGHDCVAAHCDFHLRGDESERDRQHAQNTAKRFGASYREIHFDVEAYKSLHHVSTEMACRDLRYDWFRQLSTELGNMPVAVAHHLDDNIETVMLNMLRGTGITGLAGMQPRSNGIFIRPMLDIPRDEIIKFLNDEAIDYVVDSTNLINDVKRNRLRNVVLPTLCDEFRDARTTMASTITHVRDNLSLYRIAVGNLAARYIDENQINVAAMAHDIGTDAATLLFETIRDRGFNITQARDIAASASESGRRFDSPTHTALLNRGILHIAPVADNNNEECEITINPTDSTTLPSWLMMERRPVAGITFDRSGNTLYLDPSALDGNPRFTLRHWRHGDRIAPFGMKGSRLVSDLFSDAKMSLDDKTSTWLLTRNDTILWVAGMRASRHFSLSTEGEAIVITLLTP